MKGVLNEGPTESGRIRLAIGETKGKSQRQGL